MANSQFDSTASWEESDWQEDYFLITTGQINKNTRAASSRKFLCA